jgi:hypothetical protein
MMVEAILISYALALTGAFAGAAAWPRLRVVLLTLGVIGVVTPVVLAVLLYAYLTSHPMHFG